MALPIVLAGLLVGAAMVDWLGATSTQLPMTIVVVGIGGLLARCGAVADKLVCTVVVYRARGQDKMSRRVSI